MKKTIQNNNINWFAFLSLTGIIIGLVFIDLRMRLANCLIFNTCLPEEIENTFRAYFIIGTAGYILSAIFFIATTVLLWKEFQQNNIENRKFALIAWIVSAAYLITEITNWI